MLHRDLEIAVSVLFEQRALPQRGLDQRGRCRLAVLGQQPLVQRSRVHPDPDRYAGGRRGPGDPGDLVVERPDVARVHPHTGTARVDRGVHVPGLEVDVRDHRQRRTRRDRGQRVGVVLRRYGDPYDLAARRGQFGDLLQRRVHVGGRGCRHRLHRHRRTAADRHGTNHHLPRLPPDDRNARHPQRHRRHRRLLADSAGPGTPVMAASPRPAT
jgi:hypothetical protein